ncbi:phosphoribosylamine--glycine ligase [Fulvivirga sedimenti]|uniref:Phosphoribosylamine--glycine ligase n=1 Tax=Fulvivirga sedimenti TaxID=2879465 RepID=A0A9X1HX90_9BACT|nr:phosphoribosylamine--glycine ligase [Fulvivirga sedimenti]MCA6078127.1 phosphoribosylamine--glycine ligase [Fulvivirga sedimenti]
MNILILGSGGREFTFAWKIAQSELCSQLYIAPGNAGTSQFGMNVDLKSDDFGAIEAFVLKRNIGMVVVGPEAPLVEGIRDYFESKPELDKILFIGPGKMGAQLEGSKDFSKAFMQKHSIPTAKSQTFTAENLDQGLEYINGCNIPVVLKADGLAAGKGVIIAQSKEEARESLKSMLVGRQFGEASSKVLIEEFLEGIELSVFVLTDGKDYVILPEAKDYKRIGEGDTGLNTGGMGAVSPVIFANDEFMEKVRTNVVEPTIQGLQTEGIPYQGFIFIGLMKVGSDPYVIEYNVRMGDPETQVVLPRIKNDFVEILASCAQGSLKGQAIEIDPNYAVTVVQVAGGYPEAYEKGKEISGLADVPPNLIVVHAGTRQEKYHVYTNGGRVLSVTGRGSTLEEALNHVYKGLPYIHWEGSYYRKDIGKDLLSFHLD